MESSFGFLSVSDGQRYKAGNLLPVYPVNKQTKPLIVFHTRIISFRLLSSSILGILNFSFLFFFKEISVYIFCTPLQLMVLIMKP